LNPAHPLKVGVVVVSYNSESHLGACLESLRRESPDQLLVVDNGSVDDSLALAEQHGVEVLQIGANLGYGPAANLGAARLLSRGVGALVVCNPDLVVLPGSLRALASALEGEPGVGAAGPRVTGPDGVLYPSARKFPALVDAIGHGLLGWVAPANRFTRRYRMLDWDHAARQAVDWVSGAFMLVRRQAWEEVGGFDPRYFMYMEDVDLCWRLGRAGWRVVYEPSAQVVHEGGASSRRHPYRMLWEHHRSMWLFARRSAEGLKKAALPLAAVRALGQAGPFRWH